MSLVTPAAAGDPFADLEAARDLSRRLNGVALLVTYLDRGDDHDPADAVRVLDAIIGGADGVLDLLPADRL